MLTKDDIVLSEIDRYNELLEDNNFHMAKDPHGDGILMTKGLEPPRTFTTPYNAFVFALSQIIKTEE